MGYQIGNLGPGRQSGDHKTEAIKKSPDTRVEPAANCSTFEQIWMVFRIDKKHHIITSENTVFKYSSRLNFTPLFSFFSMLSNNAIDALSIN